MTENGCAIEPKETIPGTPGATADAAVDDTGRIAYFQGYLEEMHNAIQLGADVRAVSCLLYIFRDVDVLPNIFCDCPSLLCVFPLSHAPRSAVVGSRHNSHYMCSSRLFVLRQQMPRVSRRWSSSAHQYYAWSFMDNFGKELPLEKKAAAAAVCRRDRNSSRATAAVKF